jgi:hypothetical protein
MNIVPLTLAISLCLAFTFILFFLLEHSEHRVSSAEHDSLLPLADELPRIPGRSEAVRAERHDDHDDCGCHDGSRPPCPGCLKRRG